MHRNAVNCECHLQMFYVHFHYFKSFGKEHDKEMLRPFPVIIVITVSFNFAFKIGGPLFVVSCLSLVSIMHLKSTEKKKKSSTKKLCI